MIKEYRLDNIFASARLWFFSLIKTFIILVRDLPAFSTKNHQLLNLN